MKYIKFLDTYALEDAKDAYDFVGMDNSFIVAIPDVNYDKFKKEINDVFCNDYNEEDSYVELIMRVVEKYGGFEIAIDDEIEL